MNIKLNRNTITITKLNKMNHFTLCASLARNNFGQKQLLLLVFFIDQWMNTLHRGITYDATLIHQWSLAPQITKITRKSSVLDHNFETLKILGLSCSLFSYLSDLSSKTCSRTSQWFNNSDTRKYLSLEYM